jgi:hypothetical protein
MTHPWARSWFAVTLMAAALLAAGVLSPPARAGKKPAPKPPPGPITFSAIPWFTPVDSTLSLLSARGYTEVRGAGSADMVVCQGRLYDHLAVVRAQLDEKHRLVHWWISVAAGSDDRYPEMRKVYDDIVAASVAKYGERWTWAEHYNFPYESRDGHEANALRDGSARIRSEWRVRGGDALTVEMDRQLGVTLVYECPDWAALQARIKTKKARDL